MRGGLPNSSHPGRTAALFAALLVAISMVLWGAVAVLGSDRADLLEDLGKDRVHVLQEAVIQVDAELSSVEADLRLAAELLRTTEHPEERRREIAAIVHAGRQYARAHVFDGSGKTEFSITDDGRPLPATEEAAVSEVFQATSAEILRSGSLQPHASAAFHIASTPMRAVGLRWDSGERSGVVLLAVDTGAILARLHPLASDRWSRLFVVDEEGHVEQVPAGGGVWTPAMSAALGSEPRGTVTLDAEDARRLGLPSAEAVATYARFDLGDVSFLAIAVVSAELVLEQHREIVLKVSALAAAVVALLAAFGLYAFISGRRAIALREEVRHAERIAHEREKAEKILAHVPILVVALTRNLEVTTINRALERRIGRLVSGQAIEAAFPGADALAVARIRSLLRDAIEDGRVKTDFSPSLTLFGSEGQFSLHAVPLEYGMEDTHALLVIEDLSKLGSLEAQLVRAEKLATVGVLSAGMAHEIGTPLGIARGRAEYAMSKLPDDSSQKQHLQIIIEQTDQISRLMRKLLDFSRVQKLETSEIELAHVFDRIVELLRIEVEKRGVRLEVEVSPEARPIRAVEDQLEQVLLNLVLNACQASARGGCVRICATGATDASQFQQIYVQDDGCGIPTDLRNRVFDPFFTTKKRGIGTGLGLTIVQQIVSNHGGQIELDSHEGRGTRVRLLWPTVAVR